MAPIEWNYSSSRRQRALRISRKNRFWLIPRTAVYSCSFDDDDDEEEEQES
jgi:hypothetical protein